MAQEYIAVKDTQDLGLVALSKTVFETITQIAVEDSESLVLNDKTNPFKGAISCKIQNDQLVIKVKVKVNFDANVRSVCTSLQNRIYENISHMTDYTTDVIDIKVVGFLF